MLDLGTNHPLFIVDYIPDAREDAGKEAIRAMVTIADVLVKSLDNHTPLLKPQKHDCRPSVSR